MTATAYKALGQALESRGRPGHPSNGIRNTVYDIRYYQNYEERYSALGILESTLRGEEQPSVGKGFEKESNSFRDHRNRPRSVGCDA